MVWRPEGLRTVPECPVSVCGFCVHEHVGLTEGFLWQGGGLESPPLEVPKDGLEVTLSDKVGISMVWGGFSTLSDPINP